MSSTPKSCPQDSLKSIAALVEEQNIPEAKIGLASGVSAFLWLYTSIQIPRVLCNSSTKDARLCGNCQEMELMIESGPLVGKDIRPLVN
ncbi:hypothetical protein QQ045_002290 [Rhodiola kirilowii]